jgi:hypothetical protein
MVIRTLELVRIGRWPDVSSRFTFCPLRQPAPQRGAPVVGLVLPRYLAGGGNSATNRSEMVSSSSWKWGLRKHTAR